jgi:lipopolysaccharide export system permease protein
MIMVGWTLTRYLATRFALTILAVFASIFALIYLVDFVEMLRRASGISAASGALIAYLCALRTPAVSEQVLPFAVLAGCMFAFVNLSRRLELVVARAAGVSVWQFLTPPALVVLAIGVFSVTVYNPLCAFAKEQADKIETDLFRGGRNDLDTSMWIRQRSVDGQAILRAEHSSDRGGKLSTVSVFVFQPDGSFLERVDAPSATLKQGFWELKDARVTSPEAEPHVHETYLLATYLSPEQATQSFVAPDAVSFWRLQDISIRTEQAGLDANRYRLRYQTLLARPLMLLAMLLIAASFSLRFFRFGGVARTVAGGVMAGFVLYVATKLVGDLGGAGLLSAPVAAWTPAVLGSLLGTLVLLNQEDG